jgi:hypothetical protein
MKRLFSVFALLLAVAWPAHAQQLSLQIQGGRVTLDATNVPARQILTEWARIGGTKIVGADKISGAPLTLKLVNMPERQALDIILSNVAGFMAAERQASAAPGASTYDRILILATSSPPAQTAANRPGVAPGLNSAAGTQRRIPPRPPGMQVPADADEQANNREPDDPDQATGSAGSANQPVFTFPGPQGSPGNGNNPVFVPMTNANAPVFGSSQPGAIAAPVITLQPNANGQPTIYNFVPNADGSAPSPQPTGPTTGFGGVVGSPVPGMILPVTPPPPPPPPPGQRPPRQ